MGGIAPTPAPNVEQALSELANQAIQGGADPALVSARLRAVVTHLRDNPELATHATNALADGVATPADISRKVWEQVQAIGAPGTGQPNAPRDPNAAALDRDPALEASLAGPDALRREQQNAQRQTLPGYMQAPPTLGQVGQNIKDLPQRTLAALKQAGRHAGLDVMSAAQEIPGGELLQVGGRSLVRGQPYEQAYNDVRSMTEELPKSERRATHFAMDAALAPLLPENPTLAGALFGGSSEALSAAPNQSIGGRALRTAAGTAGGALLGKAFETAGTRLRAAFGKRYPKQAFEMGDDAARVNDQNYGAAIAEAQGKDVPPHLRTLLANPDFARLADNLHASPQFRGMSETDPRFLNELYKSLSDIETGVRKGLSQLNPAKPNTKRVELGDVGVLKQQLLDALSAPGVKPPITLAVPAETHVVEPQITPGREPTTGPILKGTAGRARGDQAQVSVGANGRSEMVSPRDVQGPAGPAFQLRAQPEVVKPGVEVTTPAMRVQTAPAQPVEPYMPGYRGAVNVARQQKAEQRAFDLGHKALRINAKNFGHPMDERLEKIVSPDAIARFVSDPRTSEAEKARIVQGILSAVKKAPVVRGRSLGVIPRLSHETRVAPSLMRAASPLNQGLSDFLTKLGVVNALPSPQ